MKSWAAREDEMLWTTVAVIPFSLVTFLLSYPCSMLYTLYPSLVEPLDCSARSFKASSTAPR